MKISAISSNLSFKGLFTDKTKNENWLMEYRPYSWETYHNTNVHAPYYDVRKPVMERKQQIDITAPKLPDNEEIFTPMTKETPAISRDILGTVSYYEYPVEVKLGEFRNKITEASPMNLEESIKVYLKKHEIFRQMKNEEMQKIATNIQESLKNLTDGIRNCDYLSRRSEGFHLSDEASSKRSNAFYNLEYDTLRKHQSLVEKYIKVSESKEMLDKFILDMRKELELIEQKKKSGDIIDISVRHENDANKALYDEGLKLVQNHKQIENTQKLVLLSYKAVPLKELAQRWLKSANYYKPANMSMTEFINKYLPEGLTKVADKMMSFRL